jgi:hypothetical protein
VAVSLAACIGLVASITGIPGTGINSVLAASSPSKPNLFNVSSQAKSIKHLPPQTHPTYTATTPSPSGSTAMCKTSLLPMQPATVALSASAPSHFVSNDGSLTVDVPSRAVSSAQIASDGGATSLLVRQILPASGSNAGGSGHYSFGGYLIQVVDASGQLASHGLLQPVTLTLRVNLR